MTEEKESEKPTPASKLKMPIAAAMFTVILVFGAVLASVIGVLFNNAANSTINELISELQESIMADSARQIQNVVKEAGLLLKTNSRITDQVTYLESLKWDDSADFMSQPRLVATALDALMNTENVDILVTWRNNTDQLFQWRTPEFSFSKADTNGIRNWTYYPFTLDRDLSIPKITFNPNGVLNDGPFSPHPPKHVRIKNDYIGWSH